jgi:hypothetical protein
VALAVQTFIDMNFENLSFSDNFLASAHLAAIFRVHALALPSTITTHSLHLLHKAG